MRVEEFYYRMMNWPSQQALVAMVLTGVVLLLISFVLLRSPIFKWPARTGLAIAFGLIGFGLLAYQDQTVSSRNGKFLVITLPLHPERFRLLAQAAILGIPFVVLVGVAGFFTFERRNNRTLLPRHLKAGRRFLYERQFPAALGEFNRMIRLAPYLGAAYLGRAEVYNAMGEHPRALQDLDRAISHDPRLSAAYLLRGRIRTEQGDVDGALNDFGLKMLIQGDNAEFYLCRGICLAKKGNVADAAADFRRVLKLTNHSDFAEPARAYLNQLENETWPFTPAYGGNGSSPLPHSENQPVYPPLRGIEDSAR
jgi:tetratricopeptide (TPR) repeat protein